ncbi:MAG: hypothetical protein RL381_21 [Actinomycetota bacterium]|jgi:hypothetical protein
MSFREVIRPPLWLIAFIYFLLISLVVAIWAAFDTSAAAIALALSTFAVILIALFSRSEISVNESELRVGPAHIERTYIGEVISLTADQMRLLRTRDADPSAFLAIKFWISGGVKLIVNDERDQTPYWLISTRRAEELTRTLYR